MGTGEFSENVRPKKIPDTNLMYCSWTGRSYPSRCRFCSITTGVHDFPHVNRAGSPGSRVNRMKTTTLRANSSPSIPKTRRTMYAVTELALRLSVEYVHGGAA